MTPTTPQPPQSSVREMVEEVMDLSVGAGVALMPVLLLAVPGIILFVVLPAIVLLAVALPVAAVGAVLGLPPYLLARWLRRRRNRATPPPSADVPSASVGTLARWRTPRIGRSY